MYRELRMVTLAAAALLALNVAAAPLTPQQAKARVSSQGLQRARALTESTLQYTATTPAGMPVAYVFGGDNGYSVLAADDRAPALLGYSDTGRFDSADIPPAMQWWMQMIGSEIASAPDTPAPMSLAPQYSAEERPAIEPLVTTRWDQGRPYNLLTPKQMGINSYTGCVATAMAQLVYNRRYPEHGIGMYMSTRDGQVFNYEQTYFDYDNMLNEYRSGQYTDEQANAVATLMLACGIGVDMLYSPQASGAIAEYAGRTLRDQFGYSTAMRNYRRQFMTLDEWNALAYEQLSTYGAFLLAGANDEVGHAFVCDGYSADNFFHINWGWSGTSDGYYLLTALDPQVQGAGGSSSGYNQELMMLGNMRAPQEGDEPAIPQIGSMTAMVPATTSVTKGRSTTITITPMNYGTINLPSRAVFGFVLSGNGIEPQFWGNSSFGREVAIGTYYRNVEVGYRFDIGLEDGNYELRPAFTLDNGATYHYVDMPVSSPRVLNVLVEGNTCTYTNIQGATVTATAWEQLAPLYYDTPAVFSVTLNNDTEYEFAGNIALLGFDATDRRVLASTTTACDVMPHAEQTIRLQGTFNGLQGYDYAEGAQYTLAFAIENNGNYEVISERFSATMGWSPQYTLGRISDFKIDGKRSNPTVDPAGFNVEFTLRVTGGYFADPVHVLCWGPVSPSGRLPNVGWQTVNDLFINGPENVPFTFTASCGAFEPGNEYVVTVRIGDPNSDDLALMHVFTASEEPDPPHGAIDDVEADSNAPVLWYSLQGARVDNPGAGLWLRVQGNRAEKVLIAQ